ncbi:CPBP family intramembrane glutamic endopeptidase [Marisediminicola senii]|uniref:CPBP family intramembrane glutamic endopeptidase n=1 Tax=Marisediminicola senii TaxID=2711233 RepID=UPI0013EB3B0F|nr:type II CAAX endopeptidase family protein [Marisediminicola senii]
MNFAYHRLARSWPKYRWWKALVTGLIAVALYLGFSIAAVVVFIVLSVALPDTFGASVESIAAVELDLSDPIVFSFALGSIALMLPSVLIAALIMGPRPLGLLSSVEGRLRWGWLGRCIPPALVIYGVVFAASFLLEPATGGEAAQPVITAATWALIVLALVLTPLQATAEEYVFRGYLMQAIGGWLKHPAWAILLPVPLFAIGHDYDVWGLLDVSVFGVVAAWLTWRTGGLEAAIVAHVVNNTALFLLGAVGLVDMNADTGSAVGLLSTVVILGAYSWWVVRMAKRTGLRTERTMQPVEEPAGAPYGPAPTGAPQYAPLDDPPSPAPRTVGS